MVLSDLFVKTAYFSLPSTDNAGNLEDAVDPEKSIHRRENFSTGALLSLAAAIFLCLAGFFIGLSGGVQLAHVRAGLRINLPDPVGDTIRLFIYNETFTAGPTVDGSGAAWHALTPENGGKILHPKIAQTETVISVFHQLHCLHMVRLAFYDALEGRFDVASINEGTWHTGHCFDYLRQAIMCAADTNLEHGRPDGSFAWESPHMCRDYDRVFAFADEWTSLKG